MFQCDKTYYSLFSLEKQWLISCSFLHICMIQVVNYVGWGGGAFLTSRLALLSSTLEKKFLEGAMSNIYIRAS